MALRGNKTDVVSLDVKDEKTKTLAVLQNYDAKYIPVSADTKRIDVFANEEWNNGFAGTYEGNLALATGENGLVAIDIDKNYIKIKQLLGDYSNTLEILRHNAKTRGCLVFKVDTAPASLTILPDGHKSPVLELKSYNKNKLPDRKLIAGTYKDGVYHSSGDNIKEITLSQLNELLSIVCDYYSTDIIQAVDIRFVTDKYNQYKSGNKYYDMIDEHITCEDIVTSLGYDYESHSGKWYKVLHPDHDTIHFSDHVFKHQSANISGGKLDLYTYLSNDCKEVYYDSSTFRERERIVAELLQSKGVTTTDITTRQLMNENSHEEVMAFLTNLFANQKEWFEELKVISQTLNIHSTLLNSMTLDDLAKHKIACDKRISAQIKRSSIMLDIKGGHNNEPFLSFDINEKESYEEQFVIDNYLALGDFGLLVGDSNVGKSFLALHIGIMFSDWERDVW